MCSVALEEDERRQFWVDGSIVSCMLTFDNALKHKTEAIAFGAGTNVADPFVARVRDVKGGRRSIGLRTTRAVLKYHDINLSSHGAEVANEFVAGFGAILQSEAMA